MAQKVTLVDDLDESTEDVQTYSFAFLKRPYEIDLSAKNFDKLSKLLQPYLDAGRMPTGSQAPRTPGTSSARPARAGRSRDYDLPALREWAAKNNIHLPSRGRIPTSIVEQYQAAGGQ